ncbi:YczE/YyaS/YitT family protein [Priestia abyssalis]|uniref:YczE/YyaS/YitT family protein n=1 Tax=Priestia abyssalis TaxID=1221450 RepID=UPI00099589C1|nr:YitT family protein [Priestia abyssalis]
MKRETIIRWSFFILGLIVLAFGVALTIKGKDLGIGPWDVFHYGLFLQFGLTIGTWAIIAGFIILLMTSLVTKSLPKIGAVLNMLLLGGFIDFFNYVLPDPESMWVKTAVFTIGVIVIGYGIGLYVAPGLGAGPRDGLMLIIVEKTGWSVKWVRNGTEIIVFFFGWLLGGPVGIGTIFIAFFLGPMIGVSLPQCKALLHYLLKQRQNSVAA